MPKGLNKTFWIKPVFLEKVSFKSVPKTCFFLLHGLSYSSLALISLCSQGWPCTSDPSASTYRVLRLGLCSTAFILRALGLKLNSNQVLYLWSYTAAWVLFTYASAGTSWGWMKGVKSRHRVRVLTTSRRLSLYVTRVSFSLGELEVSFSIFCYLAPEKSLLMVLDV